MAWGGKKKGGREGEGSGKEKKNKKKKGKSYPLPGLLQKKKKKVFSPILYRREEKKEKDGAQRGGKRKGRRQHYAVYELGKSLFSSLGGERERGGLTTKKKGSRLKRLPRIHLGEFSYCLHREKREKGKKG